MTTVPIYYINLASRPDRRGFMEAQFARLGLVAERIEAATAADIAPHHLAAHRDRRNPFAVSPAEIACMLSHRRAWERVLASGAANAIILEDDAELGPDFAQLVGEAGLGSLDADLVKLESYRTARLGRVPARQVGRFTLLPLLSTHMGTAAYFASAALLQRALADPHAWRMSADRYMFSRAGPHLYRGRILQATPAPAVQLDQRYDSTQRVLATSDLRLSRRSSAHYRRHLGLAARLTLALHELRYAVAIQVHIARAGGSLPRHRIPFSADSP